MTKRAEIDAETLMAYADGELSPLEAKRVERAIAADPALAKQIDDHRRLRAMLANGFATVAEQPVPNRLTAMLRTTPVIDLARVRADRAVRPAAVWQRWGTGMAVAASLVVGVLVGQRVDNAPVQARGGALVASAGLAEALDTQLASTPGNGSLKMLVTFRNQQGAICRSFSGAALSGIACRNGDAWQLHETRGGVVGSGAQYQQAGSADAALMADAQAMMAGDPLDAAAESKARATGWR
jgi:hypothetical protein